MNSELQTKLINSFPKIKFDLTWGFECDDGWYDLIFGLFTELSVCIDKNEIKDFNIVQVKEKFATIRCYVSGDGDLSEIYQIISKYEKLSGKTCEITGKPGEIMKKGFVLKTVCPEVATKLGYYNLYG